MLDIFDLSDVCSGMVARALGLSGFEFLSFLLAVIELKSLTADGQNPALP